MKNIKYVYGSDVSFKDGNKYAIEFMGLCDTKEEAAKKRKEELHPSFSPAIYSVDTSKIVDNLTICFGFRQGKKTSGYKIVNFEGYYFNILEG